jgi:outer membrane lipoprotein-sorting protein
MKVKRKNLIIFGVLALMIIGATATIVMLGKEQVATAKTVSDNARNTSHKLKSLHIIKDNSFYEKGSVVRGTREEIWIELPNKFCKICDYTMPDGGFMQDVTVNDGRNLAVLTLDANGEVLFTQLYKNTSPFPGDERNFNPTYEEYLSQLNELSSRDNFEVVEEKDKMIKVEKKNVNETTGGQVEYWYLDADTSMIMRSEIFDNGELKFKGEVKSLTLNEGVDKDRFVFEFPQNENKEQGSLEIKDLHYTVTDDSEVYERLDYKPILPTYIPEGLRLIEVGYALDEPRVWQNPTYLVYSKEGEFLYICEDTIRAAGQGSAFCALGLDYYLSREVELSKGNAYLYPKGHADGTLYFHLGNLKVKMTGNIGLEEMKKVADSIISSAEEI